MTFIERIAGTGTSIFIFTINKLFRDSFFSFSFRTAPIMNSFSIFEVSKAIEEFNRVLLIGFYARLYGVEYNIAYTLLAYAEGRRLPAI